MGCHQPMISEWDALKLHGDALFTTDVRGRLLRVNEPRGDLAPRVYLARSRQGNFWRIRADVPEVLAAAVEAFCAKEPPLTEAALSERPRCARDLVELLADAAPIEQIWEGPSYCIDTAMFPPSLDVVRVIDGERGRRQLTTFPEWRDEIGERQPLMVTLHEGVAASLCASVRITEQAVEAGVESLPKYRRRGFALRAVSAWIGEVLASGRLPLYSTSWDNHASQRLASRLGARLIGVDFHIT